MSTRPRTVGVGVLNQANFRGGTERFESRVAVRLVTRRDPWRWRIYTRGFLPAEWDRVEGFEEIVCPPTRSVRGGRLWSEQVSWARAVRRDPPDLLVSLAFSPPFRASVPTVLAVHDVVPLERPQDYTPVARWYWRRVFREMAPRARRLLVPSRWSRERCAESLRVPIERIDVVYSGIEPEFFRARSSEGSQAIRSRVALGAGPLWLHCGMAHPRKNLEVIVRTLALLKQRGHETPTLLRVGSRNRYLEQVEQLARELGVAEHLVDAGSGVEDKELAALYAACDAFVYPSWAEGFGVPPLEALAAGAPVLVSQTACLPEILGDLPFWGDPREPESWIEAWGRCLGQTAAEREARKTRGREWAGRYTWDDTAERTLGALEAACS